MRQLIPQVNVPRTPRKHDIRPYLQETPSTKLNRKRAAKDSTNSEVDKDTYGQSPAGKDSSPQIAVLSDE